MSPSTLNEEKDRNPVIELRSFHDGQYFIGGNYKHSPRRRPSGIRRLR